MIGRLLLLVAAGVALAWPRAGEAALTGTASTAAGLTSLLSDVALHMTVLVAVWTAGAALLGWLRRIPGRLGRAADRAWAWLVPAALRAAALGASGAAVVASSAVAVDAPTPATMARWEVGRPLTSAEAMSTALISPSASTASVDASAQGRIVAPGDSLWAIAEQHLGPGATSAQVASEWPRWYVANRDVVGPDPDLLRVGTVLEAPPTGGRP